MIEGIAALSMEMSSNSVEMSAGIAVARKVMDQQASEAAGLMKMMDSVVSTPVAPPSGHLIDIKV